MSKSYIDECLERANAATPGPWVGDEFEMTAPNAPVFSRGNTRLVWAEDYHINELDADFCRHARTDVPELAKRLIEAIKHLRIVYRQMGKKDCPIADELEAPLGDVDAQEKTRIPSDYL